MALSWESRGTKLWFMAKVFAHARHVEGENNKEIDERVAGSGAVLVSVFWHDLSVVQEVHVYSCVENWREI